MQIPYRKPGKFSQIPQDPLMTADKVAELKKKLTRLKAAQPEAAAEVARLAELGDFSENAEYQLAKGKLRGLLGAIARLEHQLNNAEIITPKQTDRVAVGHTVTVETGGKQKSFQILGSSETDPQRGIISHLSPLGAALLEHRVGDTITIKLANKETNFIIKKIET